MLAPASQAQQANNRIRYQVRWRFEDFLCKATRLGSFQIPPTAVGGCVQILSTNCGHKHFHAQANDIERHHSIRFRQRVNQNVALI